MASGAHGCPGTQPFFPQPGTQRDSHDHLKNMPGCDCWFSQPEQYQVSVLLALQPPVDATFWKEFYLSPALPTHPKT